MHFAQCLQAFCHPVATLHPLGIPPLVRGVSDQRLTDSPAISLPL
jgi:hypothetical protein